MRRYHLCGNISQCAPTRLSVVPREPLVDGSHLSTLRLCEFQPVQAQGARIHHPQACGHRQHCITSCSIAFASVTAVGMYAVIENTIPSVLVRYIQPLLVSQVPLSYTITYRCAWDVDTIARQRMLKGYKLLAHLAALACNI